MFVWGAASVLITAAYPDPSGTFAEGFLLQRDSTTLDRKETATMGPKPFKPSINWSAAAMDSLRWVAIAWADQRGLSVRRAGPVQVSHAVGPAVLADHPRVLRRGAQRRRVADARRAVVVGAALGAADGAAQLPGQRPVHGGAKGGAGCGGRRRRGQTIRDSWLLDVDRDFQRAGDPVRHPVHDRHLSDAAVHHRLAHVADRPSHRRLARRQGLLPGSVHRQHHRQPRPAHPAGHRHLHRQCRRHPEHPVQRDRQHLAVRRRQRGGLGDLLRRDPVEPVGQSQLFWASSSRARCSGPS